MKKSRNLFELEEKSNSRVYWNDVFIKPLRENTIEIIVKEYDVTPTIQNYFINKISTTKSLNNKENETVYEILKDVGFYNTRLKKRFKSGRMEDALYNLPKVIAKIRYPPLPRIENVEDSS